MRINHWINVSLLAFALFMTATAAVAADVGVSVSVGQPGFYGRIDIGDYPYPQPQVIYPQPVIIHRHGVVAYDPIYLRVPPGYERSWSRYCDRYDACDRPVYFVHDRWYRDTYVPQYREYHQDRDWGRGERDHDGRGHDNGRHRGWERGGDHDRGHDRH